METCRWCGGQFELRGIKTHEVWCVENPTSPKYAGKGNPGISEPRVAEVLESQTIPGEAFQSVRGLPLEAQKDIVQRLIEELEFDDVNVKPSDIGELADVHHMLPTEAIREVLRRAMKTRQEILAMVGKGDSTPLMGLDTSISLWGDQGQLYQFLLNMDTDDLQAKIDEFWDAQEEAKKDKPKESFMDKLVEEMEEDTSVDEEQVELPWEDTPEEKTEESDWDKLQREVDQAEHLKKEAAFEERMEGMQAEHLKKEAAFEERMEGMQADLKAFQRRIWSLESETKALKEKMGALEMSTRVRKINEAIDAKVKDDRRRGYSVKSVEDYLEEFDWC